MDTVQHSTLSGTDLHEPKGIDVAVDGQVYIANGQGSGSWQTPSEDSYVAACGVVTSMQSMNLSQNKVPLPLDCTIGSSKQLSWDDGNKELWYTGSKPVNLSTSFLYTMSNTDDTYPVTLMFTVDVFDGSTWLEFPLTELVTTLDVSSTTTVSATFTPILSPNTALRPMVQATYDIGHQGNIDAKFVLSTSGIYCKDLNNQVIL